MPPLVRKMSGWTEKNRKKEQGETNKKCQRRRLGCYLALVITRVRVKKYPRGAPIADVKS